MFIFSIIRLIYLDIKNMNFKDLEAEIYLKLINRKDSIPYHIAERARNKNVFSATYNYHQQELADPAVFLSKWLQLSGPSYSISTACTSGARALISAQRMLQAGL